MIRRKKVALSEAARPDDRSMKVILIAYKCEGTSRIIKPSVPYVFMDGHCKLELVLASYNHHEVELSCDGEISFRMGTSKINEL